MFRKAERIVWRIYNLIRFQYYGVMCGEQFSPKGKIMIYRDNQTRREYKSEINIRIGDNVSINSGQKYNPIGGDKQTTLRTVGKGKIYIGNNVGISNASIVAFNKIEICDNVLIGGGVHIYDTDFHSLKYEDRMKDPWLNIKSKEIIIKEGAFVGAGCTLLKGVSIGAHSVVGAGAVVREKIPDNEIWGGNPARKIRDL